MSPELLSATFAVIGVGIFRDRAEGSQVNPGAKVVSDAGEDYDVEVRVLVEGGKGFGELGEEVT